jgi:hypothetical protein
MNLKEIDFDVAEDLRRLCDTAGLEVVKVRNTRNNLGVTPYLALAAILRRVIEGNES